MSHSTPEPEHRTGSDITMIVGGVLVVAALAASVILRLFDKDTAIVMTIIGPVVSALFVTGYVKGITGQQTGLIEQAGADVLAVKHQTNGVLDKRIREQTSVAIRQELISAGVIPDPEAPAPISEDEQP